MAIKFNSPGGRALLAAMLTAGDVEGTEYRQDDNETAILARQLEYIQSELFNIEYPPPQALQLVPMDASVPAGARTFTYREWDVKGAAEIIANYAQNLPRVDVLVKEYPQKVIDIGAAYGYSYTEIREAAFAGVNLDGMKAQTAKDVIERKHDYLVSFGDTATGVKGFLNHPNVPRVAAITGGWLSGATPEQIIQDMNYFARVVRTQTLDIHKPTTLALPLAHHAYISSTARSTTSDTTILAYFLANTETCKEVVSWQRLDTAGPSSAPMGVCYEKRPTILRAMIPVIFEQMPPQLQNLEYLINCIGRTGGCVWYRPLGGVYCDGI